MLRKNLVVTSITTYPLISNLTLKLPELPQFAGSTREVIARQLLPPFCDTWIFARSQGNWLLQYLASIIKIRALLDVTFIVHCRKGIITLTYLIYLNIIQR
jgi:hypothetical protein